VTNTNIEYGEDIPEMPANHDWFLSLMLVGNVNSGRIGIPVTVTV
jgi:hypothetical protein